MKSWNKTVETANIRFETVQRVLELWLHVSSLVQEVEASLLLACRQAWNLTMRLWRKGMACFKRTTRHATRPHGVFNSPVAPDVASVVDSLFAFLSVLVPAVAVELYGLKFAVWCTRKWDRNVLNDAFFRSLRGRRSSGSADRANSIFRPNWWGVN